MLDSSQTISGHWPVLGSVFYGRNPNGTLDLGSYTMFSETIQKVWFSARFRYWIPDIGSIQWKRRAKLAYFGLMPSPSMVWELTPWSWLVDWFSNAGDVFSNMTNPIAENLVAKYAYVMGTTQRQTACESSVTVGHTPIKYTWTGGFTRKQRSAASPFGFGLSDGDLSARQWSILSALGISRMR